MVVAHARPTIRLANMSVTDAVYAEAPVGHAHVGDVGHVRPVRSLGLEPAVHQVGPAARALRGLGGDGASFHA